MTVETSLARHSPLGTYADRFAASALDLAEEPYATQLVLRLDPTTPAATAVEKVLGVALPVANRAGNPAGPLTVIWLGPDEWLVTIPEPTPAFPEPVEGLAARLAAILHPVGGAVVDVSGQRTTVRLRGPLAREVLAKGCSVDLHPRVTRPGLAVQTMVAHAAVVLVVLDPGEVEDGRTAPLDCRLLVRSTFAAYLADWLLDAALEYSPSS